ncbi:MAG: 3-isopropylmalate dehydratase small subunit [Gemmatimonadota bacterium]
MTETGSQIVQVAGRALPVRGDDIDTDRIIPARYLRTVTFEDLGAHAFEDERAAARRGGRFHPLDDERYAGAAILLANRNFGCGSSREHAPQALKRWGIRAFVAESFAEIFFGNCVALGLPCLQVAAADTVALQQAVEADPELEVVADLGALTVRAGALTVPASMAGGPREQFVTGTWDVLGQLLEGRGEIAATAGRLPYLAGF